MEAKPPRTRPALDRDAWVQLALEVMAEEGLHGLRVEVLAKRVGVTKGSFYWHFRDRQELLDAVLQTWKDGRIRDSIKQTRAEPGREIAQVYKVIDAYSSSRSRRGMMIELAMREWARRDAAAARVVGEVDQWRLKCCQDLFIAAGIPEHEAVTRTFLLYTYCFGMSMMAAEGVDGDLSQVRQDISSLIAEGSFSIPLEPLH